MRSIKTVVLLNLSPEDIPKPQKCGLFTRLCNLKNIKGKCTFYITVQETTRGSGKIVMDVDEEKNKKGRVVKKERTFMVDRVKLDQPLVMMVVLIVNSLDYMIPMPNLWKEFRNVKSRELELEV